MGFIHGFSFCLVNIADTDDFHGVVEPRIQKCGIVDEESEAFDLKIFTTTSMKQLDPKAVWFFFLSFVLRWFLPVVFVSFWVAAFLSDFGESSNNVSEFSFLHWLWLIIPVFIVVCFVWAKLTVRFYRYELLESGFRKESGVIYKRYVTIPYDRIQNVDINRGILARLLGLSDLHIQTAGASASVSRYGMMGAGAEGRLPAVSSEVAEQLRDELIQRTRQSKNQGL